MEKVSFVTLLRSSVFVSVWQSDNYCGLKVSNCVHVYVWSK